MTQGTEGLGEREKMSRHILIVDDDKDMSFIISEMLENYGYQVIRAENAAQALFQEGAFGAGKRPDPPSRLRCLILCRAGALLFAVLLYLSWQISSKCFCRKSFLSS